MPNVSTKSLTAALADIMTGNAANAASGNDLVARSETNALLPAVAEADKALRSEGGTGTRVHVTALGERALADTLAALQKLAPPSSAQDAAFVSKDEVAAVVAGDPVRGKLVDVAYARAARLAPKSAGDRAAADQAREAFGALGNPREELNRDGSLGTGIDARPGQPGRAELPVGVLEGFDYYLPAEQADWAGVVARKLTLGGTTYFTVMESTDGDLGHLEVYSAKGKPLASARLQGDQIAAWDAQFGVSRTCGGFSAFHRRATEGYSEEPTKRAAGQITSGWRPEAVLDSGIVKHSHGFIDGFTTPTALTSEQEEVARAAFNVLHFRHLQYAYASEPEIELGLRRAGIMRIGKHVDPKDGTDYLVADWKDIDDSSFTFYFTRTASGALKLAVEQFNN